MKSTGQPKGIYVLFFTEMWERFGYYLMLGLFVLYLTDKLGFSTEYSSHYYGIYTGLTYLAPVLGGIVSDRWLGTRTTIKIGAGLMAAGYILMAYKGFFLMACGCVILGNGLFKPIMSALVGSMYPKGDSRRDAGFGIFYLGVNIGALFSGPVGGYLATKYGYGTAFKAAGIGMLIGLVIFHFGNRYVVSVPQEDSKESKVDQKGAKKVIFVLLAIISLFWAAFHQNGASWTFFARDCTDLSLGGLLAFTINPAAFSSLNSVFIIVCPRGEISSSPKVSTK
jgi:POT family proton-dependent oligopeptide transporter